MEPDWGSLCKRLWASRRVTKRNRTKVGPKPPPERASCAWCGTPFRVSHHRAKFCSDLCGAKWVASIGQLRHHKWV